MTDQVIDPRAVKTLLETTGGDAAFLDELIDVYFENSAKLLDTMNAAESAHSADEIRRAAHSLKSNSANFGAYLLAEMCKELEDLSHEGNLSDASARIARIQAEYVRVKQALERLRPRRY